MRPSESLHKVVVVWLTVLGLSFSIAGCLHIKPDYTPPVTTQPPPAIMPSTKPVAAEVQDSATKVGAVAADINKTATKVDKLEGGAPLADKLQGNATDLTGEQIRLAAQSAKLTEMDARLQQGNTELVNLTNTLNAERKQHAEQLTDLKAAHTRELALVEDAKNKALKEAAAKNDSALSAKAKESDGWKKKYDEQMKENEQLNSSIFKWSIRGLMALGSLLFIGGVLAGWLLKDYMLAVGGLLGGVSAIVLAISINTMLKWANWITGSVLAVFGIGVVVLVVLIIKRLHESVDEQTCLTQGIKAAAKDKGVDLTEDTRKLGSLILSKRTRDLVADVKKTEKLSETGK